MNKKIKIGFVNTYLKGRDVDCKKELYPAHHLWGIDELDKNRYHVTILKSEIDNRLGRLLRWLTRKSRGRLGDLEQDYILLKEANKYDIIYVVSGELILLPLLRRLRIIKPKIVRWVYKPFKFQIRNLRNLSYLKLIFKGWDGVICLTKYSERIYKKRHPHSFVKFIEWGADLNMFRESDNIGNFFLSVGKTNRDFNILMKIAKKVDFPFKIVAQGGLPKSLNVPDNVELICGKEDPRGDTTVTYQDLINKYYLNARAVIIPLLNIPRDTAGYTNLLEAMAMSKPVVMTDLGVIDIDIEKQGMGIYIEPNDLKGWVKAINTLVSNPSLAKQMGQKGRKLVQSYYNTERLGKDLSEYFEKLIK